MSTKPVPFVYIIAACRLAETEEWELLLEDHITTVNRELEEQRRQAADAQQELDHS